MYIYRNTAALSCNHRCNGNEISITYSKCVIVTLGIQHATRMLHIVICSVLQYFSTLTRKQHDI